MDGQVILFGVEQLDKFFRRRGVEGCRFNTVSVLDGWGVRQLSPIDTS